MLKAGSAARRVTLQYAAPQPGAALTSLIEGCLHRIDRSLQSINPQWVGHCKLLINGVDYSAYGSITAADDAVCWAGGLPAQLKHGEVTLYAAIYGLTDRDVAATLDAHLTELTTDQIGGPLRRLSSDYQSAES